MTPEESIQGTVDANIGGTGGDTDIDGTGRSEGIGLEDVGSFRVMDVPRSSGGRAVGNIDAGGSSSSSSSSGARLTTERFASKAPDCLVKLSLQEKLLYNWLLAILQNLSAVVLAYAHKAL
ncbi:hypothetical protein GH714_037375 [Hevea brasiliensis]|uniref:Uncharacterized protein n=1 Tax=Hevea brasiliensis TaxID=3981 RepID=A0A6A6L6U1_HEVBR|nr:hypothetical protein GH714_037375 [Hevea brasiliensis]